MRFVLVGIFTLLCLPGIAYAQMQINEIMYAPDGADADHEWIEVCNTGGSGVDLASWKLLENDTNHGLEVVDGSSLVAGSECAVIADDADVFTSDYPQFSGTLFDSTFSLKNTGEALALNDDAGTAVDTVTYSDADGASNNGLSLHRNGASWTEGSPTPGVQGAGTAGAADSAGGTGVDNKSVTLYSYESVLVEPPQDVYVRTSDAIVTTVGAYTEFSIESYESTGRSVKGGYVHWSFGDGGEAVGREARHRYVYPGTYTATVMLERDSLRDVQQIVVIVKELHASMHIAQDGSWVSIHNTGDYDLDVSHWRIHASGLYFTIPAYTIIAAGNEVRFPTELTKLAVLSMAKEARLVYEDGKTALVGTVRVEEKQDEVVAVATTTSEATTTVQQSKQVVAQEVANDTVVQHVEQQHSIIGTTVSETHVVPNEPEPALAERREQKKPQAAATSSEQLAAAVIGADAPGQSSVYWYAALGVLLFAASLSAILLRPRKTVVGGFEVIDGDAKS